MAVRWEEPPKVSTGIPKTGPILKEIATRPGRWARVSTHKTKKAAQQSYYQFTSGKRNLPPGEWEFRVGPIDPTETGPNAKHGVWARLNRAEVPKAMG